MAKVRELTCDCPYSIIKDKNTNQCTICGLPLKDKSDD